MKQSTERKDKLWNTSKYLQTTLLIKGHYSKYIHESYKSIEKKIQFENCKRI